MLEVNCDDSLDVMKRLREHRAMIIRDNRHDKEERRGERGREREHRQGGGEELDRRKCNRRRGDEGKRDGEC